MYPVSIIYESIIFQYLGAFIHSLVPSRNLGFLDMFCSEFIVFIYIRVGSTDASWPILNSQLYQFDISSNVKMGGGGGRG